MKEEFTISIDGKMHQLSKLYYTIGEMAKLFKVASSLLRYWEGEFKDLKPSKNKNGERKYTKDDIVIINKIYELVKIRGFTLDGAKLELAKPNVPEEKQLEILKQKLINLKSNLLNHISKE